MCRMENQVVLLNYAPETPFRAWKNNITLLQSSACLQGWKGQASGGIITGCNEKHKASLFESPSFIILIQCLHSATVPLLY